MSKTLYLVPTPIGNLSDMTFRAIDVLKKVSWILAEDTRVSGKLLKHFEIETPQKAYHEHNHQEKLPEILKLLQKHDLALISDAGTPGISDPGFGLVQAAIDRDIQVISLPGATAVIPALVASGLPTNQFTFLGFLPKKNSHKINILGEYKRSPMTLVIYESPYRLLKTLKLIKETLGERQVCVAREISKVFETYYRMSSSQAVEYFSQEQFPGEVVIVVGGVDEAEASDWDETKIKSALQTELNSGVGLNQAAKNIAKISGKKKSEIYQLGLKYAN